jgi:predicted DNA-binding transcriptional regulator YafY
VSNQFHDISKTKFIRESHLPKFDAGLNQKAVNNVLMFAILRDLKVDFYYQDDANGTIVLKGYREVAPVALGTHVSSGNMVFRAYVLDGVSKSERIPKWRLFRTDRVKSIKLNYLRTKAKNDKLYRPNDKHIGGMIVQADLSPEQRKRVNERYGR